ncbi:MAG: hypothetical protein JST89_13735 [Cyanobacteria bacterium SZAS-4]|nr:hypothetical protein [Cyanobacteria bacterium SZAS-4]
MRHSNFVAAVAALQLATVSGAQAQSSSSYTIQPFSVGNQGLFAASILNINLLSFFNGTGRFTSGNNFGSVSQGGLNSAQGGLGSAGTGTTGNNSNTGGTSSAGTGTTGSNINTGGTSSAGTGTTGSNTNTSNGANTGTGQSGTSTSTGTSSGALTRSFNRSRILGRQLSSNLSSSGAESVVVLTALVDSTDPRNGSAGIEVRGVQNQTVRNVSFQYSPISSSTGLISSNIFSAPYLAVTDSSLRTRYLPISSGTVVSNVALNAAQTNSSYITSSNFTSGTLNNAFITVNFNSAQLGTQGNIQKLGLVLFKSGIVLVKDVRINGSAAPGIVAQSSNSFPF